MSVAYRPWGDLDWLLNNISSNKFHFLGCLSTEERCLKTHEILKNRNNLLSTHFLEIIDPNETKTHLDNRSRCKQRLFRLDAEAAISTHELLCPIGEIYRFVKEMVAGSNGKIILDISSFPKRFFFPITKLLLSNEAVSTLIITYTVPEEYSASDLSENPLDWQHIPMFENDDPDVTYEMALIGLGFVPLGLSSLFKDRFSNLDIKLMFPFPPGAPFFQRTWKFIEDMEISPRIDSKDILRVDTMNLSEMFNVICGISDKKGILIAPYGPKTMSLAMCLYACLTNSTVYYTQPTSYNPEYSRGAATCLGYCIKLNGQSLYTHLA